MSKEKIIGDVVTVSNAVEFIKNTLEGVGLVYLAPLEESVKDEKISKAIIKAIKKEGK
jgi:hypothetical protein